ncbi:unnamed protein product, partial [Mesorhabditis spiculigera]
MSDASFLDDSISPIKKHQHSQQRLQTPKKSSPPLLDLTNSPDLFNVSHASATSSTTSIVNALDRSTDIFASPRAGRLNASPQAKVRRMTIPASPILFETMDVRTNSPGSIVISPLASQLRTPEARTPATRIPDTISPRYSRARRRIAAGSTLTPEPEAKTCSPRTSSKRKTPGTMKHFGIIPLTISPVKKSQPKRFQADFPTTPVGKPKSEAIPRTISPVKKSSQVMLLTPPPSNPDAPSSSTGSSRLRDRSPSLEIVFDSQECKVEPELSRGQKTSQRFRELLDDAATPTPEAPKTRAEKLKERGLRDGQVVRNQQDRALMHGTDCPCCSGYYGALDLSPVSRKKRMDQISRHRYVEKPLPSTPEHYWDLDFPSTPELERRGVIRIMGQKTKTPERRRLFK